MRVEYFFLSFFLSIVTRSMMTSFRIFNDLELEVLLFLL
jgi:hypothetical protein